MKRLAITVIFLSLWLGADAQAAKIKSPLQGSDLVVWAGLTTP